MGFFCWSVTVVSAVNPCGLDTVGATCYIQTLNLYLTKKLQEEVEMSDTWTDKDELACINLMRRLPETSMSYAAMHAVNEKFALPGVECCFIRRNVAGQLEMLFTQRDGTDPDWPDNWHVPGSTPRNMDADADSSREENFLNPLRRVLKQELHLTEEQIEEVCFAKIGPEFWRHARGACVSVIFLCSTEGIDFPVGKFWPIDALPQPFLGNQDTSVVKVAVQAWLQREAGK